MAKGVQPNQLAAIPRAHLEQTPSPVTGPNKGAFFPKNVGGGIIEGFYKDHAGQEVQITNQGNLAAEANTAVNVGGGFGIFKSKVGVDLELKTLVPGTGVTINPVGDTLVLTSTAAGETNTVSNEGSGEGLFIGKTGANLRFKTIRAASGTPISITTVGSEVVVESTFTETGEANTASNKGTGEGQLFAQKTGLDFEFKSLKAGNGIVLNNNADEIEIISTGTAAGGEANTGLNIGGGAGEVFKQKAGTQFEFRRLLAGAGVSITNNANEIEISATGGTGGGEANTASNAGTGVGVFKEKSGNDLSFKSIAAGTGITVAESGDNILITNDEIGEQNDGANVGTGDGNLFKQKSGTDLQFKTLKAGTNVTISDDTDEVTINATVSGGGGSGETNTASNIGNGDASIFAQKSAADLEFKTLVAGTNITLVDEADKVTINAASSSAGETNTASNLGTSEGIFAQKSGADLEFKSLKAGTNVTLTSDGSEITINASGGSGGGALVEDTAYDSSWDGNTAAAPSKNAVYDAIESLSFPVSVQLVVPTGATLADRIAAITGLPAGWSIVEGNDALVDPELTNFGATAGDLVIIHGTGKTPAALKVMKEFSTIRQEAIFDPNTGDTLEDANFNQILLKDYQGGPKTGTAQSRIAIVI